MTMRRFNLVTSLSDPRKFDMLQKAVFSPLSNSRNLKSLDDSSYLDLECVHPKTLNIINDELVRTEVLRSKRNFIASGPPMLGDKPTIEQFYDWKKFISRYLESLPGYQKFMLKIQQNLEELSDDHLQLVIDYYDLIYQPLIKSNEYNNLVRLEMSAKSNE